MRGWLAGSGGTGQGDGVRKDAIDFATEVRDGDEVVADAQQGFALDRHIVREQQVKMLGD